MQPWKKFFTCPSKSAMMKFIKKITMTKVRSGDPRELMTVSKLHWASITELNVAPDARPQGIGIAPVTNEARKGHRT